MTVKRLKELLNLLPDDYVVRFEYNGTETYMEVDIASVQVTVHDKSVLLTQENMQ